MSTINSSNWFKVYRVILFLVLLIILGGVLVSCNPFFIPVTASTETPIPITPPDSGTIPVRLIGEGGQSLTDGVIRVAGTTFSDDMDHDGYWAVPCNESQVIIGWAPGYKTSFVRCNANTASYDITLTKLVTADNPNYLWYPAGIENDPFPSCAGCHTGQRDASLNEFSEWRKSGHAKVISNRFLETVYRGTNLNGNGGQGATWDIMGDQVVRHAPIMDGSYRGPGYKLDFPAKNGNCAFCHVPTAVGSAQTEVDLSQYLPSSGGSIGEGVTCDVCHKVTGLILDDNRYPYVDRPGTLTFQFLRHWDFDDKLAFGPLTSSANVNSPSHSSACSPVYSQSEFCAACHYGKFYSTVIYGSYDEWRKSEYGSDPTFSSYQTCQDCHMSRSHGVQEGTTDQRQACSANNIDHHDHDHNMLNYGRDEETGRDIPLMIKGAATVNAEFGYDPTKNNWLTVTAKVRSRNVGHRFPTDSPLRHLILVVEVRDQRGTLLSQVDGDRIPIWGGTGDIAFQNKDIKLYAGLPGKIFANLLVEEDTNISPTVAYWNETKYAWIGEISENPFAYSDTRLRPGIVDNSRYSFDIPDKGNVTVTIRLIYRFAFYDLMQQKGWNWPDIEVTSKDWNCTRMADPIGFDCQVKE